MQIASPIPHQLVGRTFLVSISIIGVVALTELSALAWSMISRFHAASPAAAATTAVAPPLPSPAPAAGSQEPVLTDPFAAAAASSPISPPVSTSPAPAAEQPPLAALPKPTPVQPAQPTTESRLSDLIAQARALRDERGDTGTAITRLREALAIAPNNALIISELAITYEKMGLTDKALEQWRNIFDMGESAGIYYQAADAKLKSSEIASHPARPEASPRDANSVGIQAGSVLGLVNVTTVEQPDPAAQKKFTLKIPLKARANTRIDVRDVVIQVFFYDQIADGSIVRTTANVTSRWSTLPADWLDDDIEILEVDYTQPKSDKSAEQRRYYGYQIRIYYKQELQDMRADPIALLKKYPPPLTLQPNEIPQ